MMKAILVIVLSLFYFGSMAQEIKLDTTKRTYAKPKVKIIFDTEKASVHSHHSNAMLIWDFNSKIRVKTINPIIINFSNVEDLKLDKDSRSLLFKYKVERPEIISLYGLAKKYCKVNEKDILFSIDDEWQKQPDRTFIAMDAIKHVRMVNSENYPYLNKKDKNHFIVLAIKTVNPPKKEEENEGKPKIYIR